MEVNYLVIVLIIFAALCLIVLLVRKNIKDKKEFEKGLFHSEIKPEKHDDNEARI